MNFHVLKFINDEIKCNAIYRDSTRLGSRNVSGQKVAIKCMNKTPGFKCDSFDLSKLPNSLTEISKWCTIQATVFESLQANILNISTMVVPNLDKKRCAFWKNRKQRHTNMPTRRANTMKVKYQHNHIIYLISSLCQIRRIKGIRVHKQNFKWIKGFAKQNKTKKERKGKKCHIVWVCSAYQKKTFLSYNEMYFCVGDMCGIHTFAQAHYTHYTRTPVDIWLDKNGWHVAHFVCSSLKCISHRAYTSITCLHEVRGGPSIKRTRHPKLDKWWDHFVFSVTIFVFRLLQMNHVVTWQFAHRETLCLTINMLFHHFNDAFNFH